MTSLIAATANGLLFVIAAGAALAWLRAPRDHKPGFALAGILALCLVGILVTALGAVWDDPRPFVVDGVQPLIAHDPDNGFPSDHSAMAAAIAAVTWAWNRRVGGILAVLAVVLGVSRMFALVHHGPDIVAGLLAGAAAAWLALTAQGWLLAMVGRRRPARDRAATEAETG